MSKWMAIDGKCFPSEEQAQTYNDTSNKIKEIDEELAKRENGRS